MDSNPRLRLAIQNARGQNMPKDTVERAVKKASGGQGGDFTEVTFEGYGPDGVGVFVECATDNNQRTVSAVRSYFNKFNGSLGKDGCLASTFDRKGIFTIKSESVSDEDEFTMEMIDGGAEDVESEDGIITVTTAMEDFGVAQKKLEELKIEATESGLQRIATFEKEISKDAWGTFSKLIDALEDDDDVQKVYHNVEFADWMAEA